MSKKFTSGVYFIQSSDTKLIKIGCSKDINKRYNDLKAQNEHLGYSSQLILIDTILADNYYDLEQCLHSKFSENRVINEWFNINKIDIKNIKEELKETSHRNFDSGYIKIDRNATNEFIEMGLSYSDIGFIFHLKDFIDTNNALIVDDKYINQQDIIKICDSSRTAISNKINLLCEKNIIKYVKNPKDNKSNIYVMNPKYFRMSNHNINNKFSQLFIN